MTSYFDELMEMWNKTTDEHIAWQKTSNTLSIPQLMEDIMRLLAELDEFSEKTKHMKSESAGNDATILAAKFKNQYAISQFLVSVFVTFSTKLLDMNYEQHIQLQKQSKPKKDVLSPEMKKLITKQVKQEIAKYKKETKAKPKKSR